MSRSDIPPTNKKAIKCEDCGKWVTLQGYGGHRRFYHGEFQKILKQQLNSQVVNLRAMDKITKPQFITHVSNTIADFYFFNARNPIY